MDSTPLNSSQPDKNMEAEDIVAKEDFLKRRRKFESLDKIELPSRVERVKTKYGTRIFIIGTCHVGTLSKDDVTTTIRAVEPDVVMIELCDSRKEMLKDGSGGEFRRAFQETELLKKKKSCELYLGDRSFWDTQKRFWGTLTLFEKLVAIINLFVAKTWVDLIQKIRLSDVSYQTKILSKEEMEKWLERRKASNSSVTKKYHQVIVDERDMERFD